MPWCSGMERNQSEHFASLPAGITIDRRLSRAEATAAIASVVETNLHAYPRKPLSRWPRL